MLICSIFFLQLFRIVSQAAALHSENKPSHCSWTTGRFLYHKYWKICWFAIYDCRFWYRICLCSCLISPVKPHNCSNLAPKSDQFNPSGLLGPNLLLLSLCWLSRPAGLQMNFITSSRTSLIKVYVCFVSTQHTVHLGLKSHTHSWPSQPLSGLSAFFCFRTLNV